MTSMAVELLTPAGCAFSGAAEALNLPSAAGSFGVLAGHAPLLAALEPGLVRVQAAGGARRFRCGSGLAWVGSRRVVILVDTAELVPAPEGRAVREAPS